MTIWTVDVDPTSKLMASGSSDNTVRLWEVKTGHCLKTCTLPTAVRCVEFNDNGSKLLAVTDERPGHSSTIVIFDVNVDTEHTDKPDLRVTCEPSLTITCEDNKATRAGWAYLNKFIIAGHLDGSVSRYDASSGIQELNLAAHGMPVTDLQWSADHTYCITASSDGTAKMISVRDFEAMKIYRTDHPLYTASILPHKALVVLGGGLYDFFLVRHKHPGYGPYFHHKIFEYEVGRVIDHFSPVVSCPSVRLGTVIRLLMENIN